MLWSWLIYFCWLYSLRKKIDDLCEKICYFSILQITTHIPLHDKGDEFLLVDFAKKCGFFAIEMRVYAKNLRFLACTGMG